MSDPGQTTPPEEPGIPASGSAAPAAEPTAPPAAETAAPATQPAPPAYAPPAAPVYSPPAAAPSGAAPVAPPAPGYAPPPAYGYPPAQKTNVLSIISMIAAILGIIGILPFIGSVAGAIMGHISLGQIKRTGESGRGMALAGVIVGWIGAGLALIFGIVLIIAFIAIGTARVRYSSYS